MLDVELGLELQSEWAGSQRQLTECHVTNVTPPPHSAGLSSLRMAASDSGLGSARQIYPCCDGTTFQQGRRAFESPADCVLLMALSPRAYAYPVPGSGTNKYVMLTL